MALLRNLGITCLAAFAVENFAYACNAQKCAAIYNAGGGISGVESVSRAVRSDQEYQFARAMLTFPEKCDCYYDTVDPAIAGILKQKHETAAEGIRQSLEKYRVMAIAAAQEDAQRGQHKAEVRAAKERADEERLAEESANAPNQKFNIPEECPSFGKNKVEEQSDSVTVTSCSFTLGHEKYVISHARKGGVISSESVGQHTVQYFERDEIDIPLVALMAFQYDEYGRPRSSEFHDISGPEIEYSKAAADYAKLAVQMRKADVIYRTMAKCSNGDVTSCYKVALAKKGGPTDPTKPYFNDLCEGGIQDACAEAKIFFERACHGGHREACKELSGIHAEEKETALAQKKADSAAQARQEKARSPACTVATARRDYCSTVATIATLQKVIDHEKKVGDEVGYVNATALQKNGSSKVYFSEMAEQMSASYKKITGKDLQPGGCGLVDDSLYSTRVSTEVLKKMNRSIELACGNAAGGE